MIATSTEEADHDLGLLLKGEKDIERGRDMRIRSTKTSEGTISIVRTNIEAGMKVKVIDSSLFHMTK